MNKKIVMMTAMALAATMALAAPRTSKKPVVDDDDAPTTGKEAQILIDQFPKLGRQATLAAPSLQGASIVGKCYNKPRSWIVLEAKYTTYAKFLEHHIAKDGLKASKFELGATNQFALRHNPSAYPNFKIENVCSNGVVWDKFQNKFINVYEGKTIRENASSCGFVIRYGNFDYLTAGDIGDYNDYEYVVAQAVGKVDAVKAHHHLSPHSMNEKCMSVLQPQVMAVTSFGNREIQPEQKKILSISKGGCNIYCTSVGEKMLELYPKIYKKCRAVSGHIVFRVEPDGEKFWVYVLDDFDSKYRIKMVDGPFKSK